MRIDPEPLSLLTADLCSIPSFETEGAVQALIAERLTAIGFSCDLDEVFPGRPNLLAQRGVGGPFLCSHADTQAPFAHPDPFRVRTEGSRLVGRGVLDAKGQIAAMIAALAAVPDAPAVVLITCDEESGGEGSLQARLPVTLDRAAGGLVLEPTALRPCIAQAGNVEVVLEAYGRAVHMAEPERGEDALEILREGLDALARCAFLRASHPLLPRAWRHVGRVRAGEHLWRLPGRASCETSLAVLPRVDLEAAEAEVREVLDPFVRSGRLRYELRDANPGIELPPGLPALQRLRRAGAGRVSAMRSWTDAAHLLVQHELPCVVFGAGELWPAHSDHEWVELGDLVALAEKLVLFLRDGGHRE